MCLNRSRHIILTVKFELFYNRPVCTNDRMLGSVCSFISGGNLLPIAPKLYLCGFVQVYRSSSILVLRLLLHCTGVVKIT